MDEINAFFDFSKEFKRDTAAPRGCTSGNLSCTVDTPCFKKKKEDHSNIKYTKDIVANEQKLLEVDMDDEKERPHYTGTESALYNLDDLSDDDTKTSLKLRQDDVYEKYHFDLQRDETLPIYQSREKILEMIRNNPVVILEGSTGCGKTTQVPQYILDDAFVKRKYCKIVCTQPRRIAALSIARRVCGERKWEEGTVVGYQISLHANLSEDTRIVYCTTGVLLQKLIRDKSLNSFTHVIIDEVHERDEDLDFMLIVVRRFLATKSRNVKVILMSATIDTSQFANYFAIRGSMAPIIRVDKQRLYQVKEYYLNDLASINPKGICVDISKPDVSEDMYHLVLKLLVVLNNIERKECDDRKVTDTGLNSILVFMPGINEIDRLYNDIENFTEKNNINVKFFPIRLHSLIPPEEQVKVFHRAAPLFRKVILATNVGESSITVPDVKHVIDFCLVKVLVTNSSTNFSSLQLQWASKANCRQRAGRAGRLMNGRVYRLVQRSFYDKLDEYPIPEILRTPLDNIVLKAKLLEMGPPANIIGLAMNPPNLSDVLNTIMVLKEIGALYKCVNGVYSPHDGDLSFLGRIMSHLPINVHFGRLIMLGYIYSVLEEAIIIAAGLSVRSIFKIHNGSGNRDILSYNQRLTWADGSGSDLLAIYKAYVVWSTQRQQNKINDASEKAWCNRYYINLRSMKEMHLLVLEIKSRLMFMGIQDINRPYQRVRWMDREKSIILKIIIAGAFYPYYFIRSNKNDLEQDRDIYHILSCRDPCNTIYFTNFNPKFIGQLYSRRIKEFFSNVNIPQKNICVSFDKGSEKIFITFTTHPDDEYEEGNNDMIITGRIRPEIYKAIKMRHLNFKFNLRVMNPQSAVQYGERCGIGKIFEGMWTPIERHVLNAELMVLPTAFVKTMVGHITHIKDCGKFYFRPLIELGCLEKIHKALQNVDRYKEFIRADDIQKGMILSAACNGGVHKRARVLHTVHASRRELQFRVLFIDYGSTAVVHINQLRPLPEVDILKMPPRVFVCRLANVQPSSIHSLNGKWSEEVIAMLDDHAKNGAVEIEIYSVVEAVVTVFLKIGDVSFNDMLVEKGYARKSDENYMSMSDHDYRLRKQSLGDRFRDDDYVRQNEDYIRSLLPVIDIDVEPPPMANCTKGLELRGPYSPLETKIYSPMRIGKYKSVVIDRESVNSVLLDCEPQDLHERLYVAANVCETIKDDVLSARATTQMPNIHGFGALMTLLFCPTMQIKRNSSKTKYVAILAGLGYKEDTFESLFAEHDISLSLDVDILTDDLELINQLRYSMDSILYTNHGEELPNVLPAVRADLTAKIKNLIIRLLNKSRKFIEMETCISDNTWEHPDGDDIIETPQIYGSRSIFPLHSSLRLYDEKLERRYELRLHCKELHNLKQFDVFPQFVRCDLCNQSLNTIVHLRIHLLSQMHRDREMEINFNLSDM